MIKLLCIGAAGLAVTGVVVYVGHRWMMRSNTETENPTSKTDKDEKSTAPEKRVDCSEKSCQVPFDLYKHHMYEAQKLINEGNLTDSINHIGNAVAVHPQPSRILPRFRAILLRHQLSVASRQN